MDAAGVAPSRPTEPTRSSALQGGAAVAESSNPVNANGWSVGGQDGPATHIPQLLREQGGHMTVTNLWEAYQGRFGVTPYALKDLFGEVNSRSSRTKGVSPCALLPCYEHMQTAHPTRLSIT